MIKKERVDKNAPPQCPFCGADLLRPSDMMISDGETGQGGVCSCGAFYLVDPTGKNVGSLMANALNRAADELHKEIGSLIPDEDYREAILAYDWRRHQSSGVSRGYMDGGQLYIMKINRKKN